MFVDCKLAAASRIIQSIHFPKATHSISTAAACSAGLACRVVQSDPPSLFYNARPPLCNRLPSLSAQTQGLLSHHHYCHSNPGSSSFTYTALLTCLLLHFLGNGSCAPAFGVL